jgi:hypothetical protein
VQFAESARQKNSYDEVVVAQVVNSRVRRIRGRVLRLVKDTELARILASASNGHTELSNGRNCEASRHADFPFRCQDPLHLGDLRGPVVQAEVLEPVDRQVAVAGRQKKRAGLKHTLLDVRAPQSLLT